MCNFPSSKIFPFEECCCFFPFCCDAEWENFTFVKIRESSFIYFIILHLVSFFKKGEVSKNNEVDRNKNWVLAKITVCFRGKTKLVQAIKLTVFWQEICFYFLYFDVFRKQHYSLRWHFLNVAWITEHLILVGTCSIQNSPRKITYYK